MLGKIVEEKKLDRNFSPFDQQVFKELFLTTAKNNPFHTDCKFTRKRVCYCNYHASALIDEKSRQDMEAQNRYLRVLYSGASSQDIKRSLVNHKLASERVKRVQELEDLYFLEPKFEGLVNNWKESQESVIREQIVQEQKNLIINGQCSYCQTTHSNKYYEILVNSGEHIVACEECAILNHPEVVTFNNKVSTVKPETLMEKKKKRQEAQAKRLQTLQAKKLLRQSANQEKEKAKGNNPDKQDKDDDDDDSDGSETMKECNWEKCKKKKSDPEDILVCKGCHKNFHAECCDPPLEKGIVSKYDWYCTECKLCVVCGKNTKENELLMCDCCDRPFHMSCLDPPRTYIPEGRWFCKDCEKCVSCGVNLFQNYSRELLKLYSQQQVDNKIVCKDCWVYYKLKKYCPICFKIIEENEEGNFVNCDQCKLWLHYECERKLSNRSFREINRAKYFQCSKCKPVEQAK